MESKRRSGFSRIFRVAFLLRGQFPNPLGHSLIFTRPKITYQICHVDAERGDNGLIIAIVPNVSYSLAYIFWDFSKF